MTAAVIAGGCALRLALALAAPRWAFIGDHVANLVWGMGAAERGIARVYSLRVEEFPTLYATGYPDLRERKEAWLPPSSMGAPNHPPLTLALYALQAGLLRETVDPLVLNTVPTRVLVGATHALLEGLLALAVGWLAASLWGSGGWTAAAAAWLFPPLALNAAFWSQVDGFFLAPVVASVALMLRGRWSLAGGAAALALLIKPQGVLLGPIVLFAAFADGPRGERPAWREVVRRLGAFTLAALLAGVAVALPWLLQSGWRWLDNCYRYNILEAYPVTTLKAFSIWYVDLLLRDARPEVVLDATTTLLGVSRDLWGRGLLVAAALASAVAVRRRYGGAALGVAVFAALWLWSAYVWPTRVHERYVVYCMPFVVALAVGRRRFLPALAGLLVVGVAAHTWNIWMRDVPAGSLVTIGMVQARQRENVAAFEEARRSPGGAGGVAPTEEAALEQVKGEAAGRVEHYLAQRRPVRRLEVLVTALSLMAYAAGLWAAFSRARARRATADA